MTECGNSKEQALPPEIKQASVYAMKKSLLHCRKIQLLLGGKSILESN